MKKIIFFLIILSIFGICFAQEAIEADDNPTVAASKGGYAEVPPAKRPKPIDQEKAQAADADGEGDGHAQKQQHQKDNNGVIHQASSLPASFLIS